MYYVPLFTSDYMCMNSLFSSDSSQCTIIHPTLILIKTLWFIHINTVFSPHIYCIHLYSKHPYENKVLVSHDMSIMFRDQSIMGFPQVTILRWLQFIYRSNRSFNTPPPPPGQPPGYLTFWKIIVQIPPTLACEAQTHFRSSLLSLRKIASANPSG